MFKVQHPHSQQLYERERVEPGRQARCHFEFINTQMCARCTNCIYTWLLETRSQCKHVVTIGVTQSSPVMSHVRFEEL